MPLWLCAFAGVAIKSGRSCHADEISFRQIGVSDDLALALWSSRYLASDQFSLSRSMANE